MISRLARARTRLPTDRGARFLRLPNGAAGTRLLRLMVQRIPTAAALAARSPSTGPAAVVLETFRRCDAGEAIDDLVAPECRTLGDPTGFLPPGGERRDPRVAELAEQHLSFRLRDVVCQDDRHALYHGVWVRELPGGGGSAGRFSRDGPRGPDRPGRVRQGPCRRRTAARRGPARPGRRARGSRLAPARLLQRQVPGRRARRPQVDDDLHLRAGLLREPAPQGVELHADLAAGPLLQRERRLPE